MGSREIVRLVPSGSDEVFTVEVDRVRTKEREKGGPRLGFFAKHRVVNVESSNVKSQIKVSWMEHYRSGLHLDPLLTDFLNHLSFCSGVTIGLVNSPVTDSHPSLA